MTTALLLMDLHASLLEQYDDPDFLPRINSAAKAARAAEYPVIWVRVEFRDGYPEVSSRNKNFSRVATTGAFLKTDKGAEFPASLDLQTSDIVVVKKRISAFAGSDLSVILRAQDVDSLVLAGVSTAGVVLSTVRAAADLDYRLTVLADCCKNGDEEVHRFLVERLFPSQAEVLTVDAWINSIDSKV